MSEGAALLVDHVLPAVGYRQWVLSFQGPLAVRLGYDTDLLAAVCEQLARALMQDLRRDVKRRHDLASVTPLHAGVMVAVQRAHADMDIDKFLARLCALVPPPGFHMVRYFGVLRPRGVPGPGAELPGQQLWLDLAGRDEPEGQPESKAPRRIGWASLLARVFAVDVTVCRKCGGRMRILEVVDTPDAVARVLHGARAPPRPPPPGQLVLLH